MVAKAQKGDQPLPVALLLVDLLRVGRGVMAAGRNRRVARSGATTKAVATKVGRVTGRAGRSVAGRRTSTS